MLRPRQRCVAGVLFVFFLFVLLGSMSAAVSAQERPRGVSSDSLAPVEQEGQQPRRSGETSTPTPPNSGPGLSDWYPFDSTPPFVATKAADGPQVIHAGNARFLLESPPVLPEELRINSSKQFSPGWWIVHFRDGVTEDAKQLLDDVTGEIFGPDGRELARWYLPNRALIAYFDSRDAYQEVATSDLVDGLLPYHPGFKLSQFIGSAELTTPWRKARRPYFLNVDLIPGAPVAAIREELEELGLTVRDEIYIPGLQTYDVHYLVVESSPSQIVDIAGVEGVRLIQEAGDGLRTYDISGGGKLQARTLSVDDGSNSPIVDSASFPLWLTHNLQGQGQLIGVVDTSMDPNNTGVSGCGNGYPDTAIDNWGFALPNLSRVLIPTVGAGGVNLKIPRSDELGGATLQGTSGEHGQAVAGAALADFYGNNDTKWWEHDVDEWESWAPSNYSGLLGPGIAHEAQLFFTSVLDNNGGFRWETFGEFPTNMSITLGNMANAGAAASVHSTGLAESSNTYTQTSAAHDLAGFDHPTMLQCMAAGNSGAVSNALTSQSVIKNNVAVGASDDVLKAEDRVTFSSIGPAFDGRTKPDIMAPGSDTFGRTGGVQSLLILPESNGTSSASCAYQWTSGTSFSAPTLGGAVALIHQYFEEGRYSGATQILDPSAALMRSMLVNGGHRLTGANLGNGNYPNGYQGWGEPNLSDIFELPGGSRNLIAFDISSGIGFTGPSSPVHSFDIAVNSSSQRLRVAMSWTDEPGSTGTGKKLINDLHLTVTSPGGTVYRGNVINGSSGESTSGGTADTLNNTECVILSNPAVGTWTVTVDPSDGNYSVGQGYAVVVTGDVSENTTPSPPVADFTGSPTSGDSPLVVSFNDQSTGNIDTWDWNFGDGGSSSAASPSHTYNSAGTYTVTLTVSGPGGSDTRTRASYVTVTTPPPAPVANFSGTPTSGTAPLAVSFSDQSSGSISTYSWNFGDGGTSSATSPSHTYTSAGTYDVSLTVSGPGGSDTLTRTSYISVSEPPPVADFSGTPTSGNAPLVVSFSDASTGSVSAWSWDFGDGGSSTSASPSHTYSSAGTYDVSLTVTGPGGSDTVTRVGYISVSVPPAAPVADFSASPTSGTAPLLVSFSDQSTGSISSWSWNFGDGGSSTAQSPSHTYSTAGTYTVSLTVTGPGGSDTSTQVGLISVAEAPPVVGFSANPLSGNSPLLVVFTDESVGSIGSWSWNFGDGGTSTSANPSHTYNVAGTYTVSLTVTGPGGSDTVTRVDYITVSDPPVGGPVLYMSFTTNTAVPGVGTVRDDDIVSYDPTTGTWEWIFDGSDVGIGSTDINALSVLANGTIVMSFNASFNVPGVGTVDDSDLVLFTPSSLGSNTSGAFSFYFDGSDVGLSANGEDIDGVEVLDDGSLLISTLGSVSANGASGRDEDVLLFTPTSIGVNTSGSFSLIFDGSDVGLSSSSSEDLNAISLDFDGTLLFSTVGSYSASGGSGADEDISRFTGSFGSATSGSINLELDLSALGISTREDVDGLCIR